MPSPPLLIVGYLACHFLAYGLVFRKIRYFQTETGIFRLHAWSFALVELVLMLLRLCPILGSIHIGAPLIILSGSLHGIYSLSFLELWSLTEGSFSLSIINHIAQATGACSLQSLLPLAAIGAQKTSSRVGSLASSGLLRPKNGPGYELTRFGRISARCIRLLFWFSGGRGLNQ